MLVFEFVKLVIKLANKYIEKVSQKAPKIPKNNAKKLSLNEILKYL